MNSIGTDSSRPRHEPVASNSNSRVVHRAELASSYVDCLLDNRYHLKSIIGEGGMGIVYQGEHVVIGKRVAVKILRSDLALQNDLTTCFLNEARAASAIGNPHIIDISDFGYLPNGSAYLVMELLDGAPLSRILRSNHPVPIERILKIGQQLAAALAAAHEAGIVHRDLKPDNIFLVNRGAEKDFVKILDFGIAKISKTEDQLAGLLGPFCGSPLYMSPEQAAGKPVDHRVDIYSLGIILYELVTGKVPFDGDNFMEVLNQHTSKKPPPFDTAIRSSTPLLADLEAVILRCLAKRPEQRYPSMRALAAEFEILEREAVVAETEFPSHRFALAVTPHHSQLTPAKPRNAAGRWQKSVTIAGALSAITVVAGFALSNSGRVLTPWRARAASRVASSGEQQPALAAAACSIDTRAASAAGAPVPSQGPSNAVSQTPSQPHFSSASPTTHAKANSQAVLDETPRQAQAPSPTTQKPAPNELNRAAANAALAAAAAAARACVTEGAAPTSKSNVAVTFAPDGSAAAVAVSQQLAGTTLGSCVTRHYRSIKIPAFAGEPTTLFSSLEFPH